MPEVMEQGAPAPKQEDPAAKVASVGQGLAELAQMAEESGAPPEALQALQASLEAFTAFSQSLGGGGQEPEPEQNMPVDAMGGQGVPMDNRRPA